jgi:hypothetical protein
MAQLIAVEECPQIRQMLIIVRGKFVPPNLSTKHTLIQKIALYRRSVARIRLKIIFGQNINTGKNKISTVVSHQ